MKEKNRMIGMLGIVMLVLGVGVAIADTADTTVTFVIPADVDHSVSYGASCSASLFYFVESDTNKDGSQTNINVSSDSAGSNVCQNSTTGSMTVNNIGSVNLNITAAFTAALPSGVVVKAASANAGYEASCTGVVNDTACGNVSDTPAMLLEASLTAQTGTEELWWWADFSNFNSGVSTAGVARTLRTTGTQTT